VQIFYKQKNADQVLAKRRWMKFGWGLPYFLLK